MAQKHNPEYTDAPMTRYGTLKGPEEDKRVVRTSAFVADKWTADNPILQLGELGYETDTNKLKIGDGVTAWNDLAYAGDGAGAVESVNGKTGAVVLTTADLGATTTTATLAAASWADSTQTVSVTGVTATNTVFVAPAPASASDYATGGVLCTTQATGSLTFTCTATPANDITVNVVIFG